MNSLIRLCLCALFLFSIPRTSGAQTSSSPPSATSVVSPSDSAWKSANELYKRRQWSRAEDEFDAFRRRFTHDPRSLEALRLSGVCRRERGDLQGAIRSWSFIFQSPTSRLEDRPVIMKSVVHLYDAWDGSRDAGERERLLSRLLSEFPEEETTVRLHEREGLSRFGVGDFCGAVRFLSPVADRLGGMERRQLGLASILSSQGSPDVRVILDAADESFVNDDVEEAIKLYRLLLEQNADQNMIAEARTKLGWCLYTTGNRQESEKLWQSVINDGPRNSDWVALSRWHMIQLFAGPKDQFNTAIKLCEVQIREFPNHAEGERAMLTRAWLYWTRKDWAKAKAAFEELTAAYPHTANAPPILRYIADCRKGMSK